VRALQIPMLALLVGCNFSPANNDDDNRPSPQLSNQTVVNELTADDPDLKYFPLSKYQKYPVSVRELIRRADLENDRCREGRSDDPETYYSCNRRGRIMDELEKRSWCRGGADVGYLLHWLKCADDPYYPPEGRGPDTPYSEEGIREATQPDEGRRYRPAAANSHD